MSACSSKDDLLHVWLKDVKLRHNFREKNIQILSNSQHLDEARLLALDSSVKKVTTFMKKLKNIVSPFVPALFQPELEKLNVSKYLDEIATAICEAKIKLSDVAALVEFCVRLATLYDNFPALMLIELKKHIPHKKSDQIANPSKLRVDLRLLGELVLSGILSNREGISFLGNALSFLVNTDRTSHANVGILMPFCRASLFEVTGIIPLAQATLAKSQKVKVPSDEIVSKLLSAEQRSAIATLLNSYLDSLLEHVNMQRVEMNRLQKSIKRQERTRGDASADDRQRFDQIRTAYEQLLQSGTELSECMGREVPPMVEEPSEDERDEAAARKLSIDLNAGRLLLWGDRDTQIFYENLADVHPYVIQKSTEQRRTEDAEMERELGGQQRTCINELIENVDLSELERDVAQQDAAEEDMEEVEQEEEQPEGEEETTRSRHPSSASSATAAVDQSLGGSDLPSLQPQQLFVSMNDLLVRLSECINRELIDTAALEFLAHLGDKKANRKRLTQHFLVAPADRLDLLPFYSRFIATIRPVYPEIALHILHELLARFHQISDRPIETSKKPVVIAEDAQKALKINAKLHLCAYLGELAKFSILPKAEALSLLRSLLVNLRSYKVDMLSVMVESMGLYLYRSPESHAKMSVIMQVLRNKSSNIKDPRQKILLDNAYFSVIPPDEQMAPVVRLPPMQEYILQKLSSADFSLGTFRRINWEDEELAEFTLKLFSTPNRVRFEDLAKLASLVSALSDYHDWVGVHVMDELLEFIRLALETNSAVLQQRLLSSVVYLGQLYNYNVCSTSTVFHVLYQLITLALPDPTQFPTDNLFYCSQRIRLATELVNVVCEFFGSGSSKRRMDNFLHFLLKFNFETLAKWSEHVEVLGLFPEDTKHALNELLKTWRKCEKFPTTLEEAQLSVANIENQYKAKFEEVMTEIRARTDDGNATEDQQQRLKCIVEEGDEWSDEEDGEEEEDAEGEVERRKRGSDSHGDVDDAIGGGETTADEAVGAQSFDEEDEHIRVHTHYKELLQEDEDFMRDFDRLMAETMQSAPTTLQGPIVDLAVPPQARQKFERKITFVSADPSKGASTSTEASNLLPVGAKRSSASAAPRMALLTKSHASKGGGSGGARTVVLRPVNVGDAGGFFDDSSWQDSRERYQREKERDRQKVKAVTLALSERIQQQQADEQLDEARLRLNGVIIGLAQNEERPLNTQ